MAGEGECPKCDKEDDYDGDKVRMIRMEQFGGRFGVGPSEGDLGVDIWTSSTGKKKKMTRTLEPSYIICCNVM